MESQRITLKTCIQFKTHTCKEYNKLRKVEMLSIQQSNLNPQVHHTQVAPTDSTKKLKIEIINKL